MIHRVERSMSVYDGHSEIWRLNLCGRLARPDPWTVSVLRQAQAFAASSDGAFDITVQPLWRLFQRHAEGLMSKNVVGADGFDQITMSLRRVERYWTDQIRYIY